MEHRTHDVIIVVRDELTVLGRKSERWASSLVRPRGDLGVCLVRREESERAACGSVHLRIRSGGDLRTVRALRAYLNERDGSSPALFKSQKSNRMTGKGVNDVVKRLANRAAVNPYTYEGRGGPDDVSAHTLRHSVAWRMLRAEDGNTLYDVRNRLRHATIVTTEREYDHFDRI